MQWKNFASHRQRGRGGSAVMMRVLGSMVTSEDGSESRTEFQIPKSGFWIVFSTDSDSLILILAVRGFDCWILFSAESIRFLFFLENLREVLHARSQEVSCLKWQTILGKIMMDVKLHSLFSFFLKKEENTSRLLACQRSIWRFCISAEPLF